MSDRPIQVGDLVQVVKWESCGCCLGHAGTVLGFCELVEAGCTSCDTHGPKIRVAAARIENRIGILRAPIAWLKRIPPLEELEGQRTQEDIKEPA